MQSGAEEYSQSMRRAAEKYRYPAKLYDFIEHRELDHGNDMPRVERLINTQLMGENRNEVKDGLSNVLYWGYVRRVGLRRRRVCRFRDAVEDNKLDAFVEWCPTAACSRIEELKQLGLPEFGGMSFASKVLMFMCPDRYPVLDLKIARFAHRELGRSLDRPPGSSGLTALQKLKVDTTTIRLTKNNMQAYEKWADWCCGIADAVNGCSPSEGGALRAVDVERGIFWCIDQEQDADARRLLLGPK